MTSMALHPLDKETVALTTTRGHPTSANLPQDLSRMRTTLMDSTAHLEATADQEVLMGHPQDSMDLPADSVGRQVPIVEAPALIMDHLEMASRPLEILITLEKPLTVSLPQAMVNKSFQRFQHTVLA